MGKIEPIHVDNPQMHGVMDIALSRMFHTDWPGGAVVFSRRESNFRFKESPNLPHDVPLSFSIIGYRNVNADIMETKM